VGVWGWTKMAGWQLKDNSMMAAHSSEQTEIDISDAIFMQLWRPTGSTSSHSHWWHGI